MTCKTCKKEYDIGADHKIKGFSYLHFCSDKCAKKWIEKMQKINNAISNK